MLIQCTHVLWEGKMCIICKVEVGFQIAVWKNCKERRECVESERKQNIINTWRHNSVVLGEWSTEDQREFKSKTKRKPRIYRLGISFAGKEMRGYPYSNGPVKKPRTSLRKIWGHHWVWGGVWHGCEEGVSLQPTSVGWCPGAWWVPSSLLQAPLWSSETSWAWR